MDEQPLIFRYSDWIENPIIPHDGPENLVNEPQTSSSGGNSSNWKTFTIAPEEPDPENLGKRIKNLSSDEARQLYYYLRCKYGIKSED